MQASKFKQIHPNTSNLKQMQATTIKCKRVQAGANKCKHIRLNISNRNQIQTHVVNSKKGNYIQATTSKYTHTSEPAQMQAILSKRKQI